MKEFFMTSVPQWAYMIATAALAATATHLWTVYRESKASKNFKKTLLLALRTELQMISNLNKGGIGGQLLAIQPGEFLCARFSLTEDYFTVYNTNCSQLPKLDQSMAPKIVAIYTLMKAQIDAYRIHNGYLDKKALAASSVEHVAINKLLVENTAALKDAEVKIQALIDQLLAEMDHIGIKFD